MSDKEIKEALELIGDADTSTANYHLLAHEQKKALARIENRAPEWLRAQRTLIDQQAREMEQREDIIKRKLEIKQNAVDEKMTENHQLKSSLELAVKALEAIEKGDDSYHTELSEAKTWIELVEEIAEHTLLEIRRTNP